MQLKLFKKPPGTAQPDVAIGQVGAIPYTHVDGQIVFLMITTRRTGRWIFPKGGRIDGLTDAETAAQEAFEEAGVRGRIASTPIGTYRTQRFRPEGNMVVDVAMYPLEVTEQLDNWPEKHARSRHWVILAEARRLLAQPDLVALAEQVALSGDDL